MNFAEALSIFCDKYCSMKMAGGDPVMLSEFVNGLTLMLIGTLESLDAESREALREAIKAALDDDKLPEKGALN